MPSSPAVPPGRYGTPPTGRSRGVVAAAALLGGALLAWVVWAALGAAAPDVRGEVTAFRIRSDTAIEVRVAAAPGTTDPLACTVRALDRTRGEVGIAGVRLDPASPKHRERWVTIRTRDRAVTATIGGCTPVR